MSIKWIPLENSFMRCFEIANNLSRIKRNKLKLFYQYWVMLSRLQSQERH